MSAYVSEEHIASTFSVDEQSKQKNQQKQAASRENALP
jgi:hypothetical protein